MPRLIVAMIALTMIGLPAAAQTATPASDCASGTQATGATDCTKPENRQTEVKPPVPATNLKDTVIPKAGAQQTPETTPTTGVTK